MAGPCLSHLQAGAGKALGEGLLWAGGMCRAFGMDPTRPDRSQHRGRQRCLRVSVWLVGRSYDLEREMPDRAPGCFSDEDQERLSFPRLLGPKCATDPGRVISELRFPHRSHGINSNPRLPA